jgi:hypothetical protein
MVIATKRMFLAILPRLLISLVIGVLIAEPLTLRIFQPEINHQLQQNQQLAIERSTSNITNYYGPKITADESQISALRAQESTLQSQINQDDFVAACEAGEVGCSLTRELGCGPVCQHYQQLATTAQNQLNSQLPADNATITELTTNIQSLQSRDATQTGSALTSISGGNGLIAREDALSQIMRAHPGVADEVWFIRAGLVLLDLLPLIIKYLYIAMGDAAYEKLHAARRRQQAGKAHGVDVETRVQIAAFDEQGLADEEVNRVRIEVDRDRRIADIEGEWYQPDARPSRDTNGESRIPAVSLSEYVGKMRGHETLPVPMPAGLRMAGWVGTGLIAAMAVVLGAISYYSHRVVTGEWLTFASLLMAVSLMAFTKGFREAPSWALRATLAALLAGLALPAAVLAMNL